MTSTPHGAITRIRTPHPHDVLAGRGGGINSHEGNKVFRDHVKVYKNDYNLARSKAEKARVARKVMELIQSQSPPGRFLQREANNAVGTYWVEIDDAKAMAKTSQALREGAPSIRAQNVDTPMRISSSENLQLDRQKRKRETNPAQVTPPSNIRNPSSFTMTIEQAPPALLPVKPLMSNSTFARQSKMMKTFNHDDAADQNATPTLMPTSPTNTPEVLLLDQSIPRSRSLENLMAVSNEKSLPDFVNPFDNEEDLSSLIVAPSLSSSGSKRSVKNIEDSIPMDDFLYLMDMVF